MNFIGALLLVIASILSSSIVAKIIKTIGSAYGTWSMEKLPDDLVRSFNRINSTSKMFNLTGFMLFVVGFSLQFLSIL